MNSALQLQLAAASYIFIHRQILKKQKRKSPRWWVLKLYQSRKIYSGSSLLADLKFQHISGLYKNFTRMHPTDFEFLLNSIGPFLATGDSYVSMQYLFKISKQSISRIVPEVCDALTNTLKNYIQVSELYRIIQHFQFRNIILLFDFIIFLFIHLVFFIFI